MVILDAEWISVASIINEYVRKPHNFRLTQNLCSTLVARNSFISWATDFYGRNDLDMV